MKSMLRHWSIIISLFAAVLAHGQSVDQWTTWGDAAMERSEYYGASRFYEGALGIEPGRMQLQWKHAEASRLSNQYDKAAEHYARVYQKDQGRTYPDALRWLAEMQMSQGLYDEAEKSWNKLLQRERKKDSFNAKRAGNGVIGCALSKEWMAAPPAIDVEHLSQPVNTYDSEFGARIGPDDKLYLASLRGELNKDGEVKDTADYRTRIYQASPSNGAWTEPEAVGSAINAEGENANIAWNLDGSKAYFTRCLPGGKCRIHVFGLDTEDARPEPLKGLGDSMSTQPMIVRWEDRAMLLFVSDREGGQGGTDIWQAEIIGDSAAYVHPLNGQVNTIGNERTPWFDASTNTLYFSSDFLPGMGGFDLFTSALSNDVFAEPVNAGSPLNSPANDLYPYIDSGLEHIWFASNRIGSLAAKGATCCSDIYRSPLEKMSTSDEDMATTPIDTTTINGTDPPTSTNIRQDLAAVERRFPITLYFHNDDPDPRSWNKRTEQTYEQAYQRYKGLLPEYREHTPDTSVLNTFIYEHVDAGWALLNDLVDVLIPAMEQGEHITLAVRGHASPLAKSDYNENLSLRRISSLRNHLRKVRNGALLPFTDGTDQNGGRLTIKELPFGEERAGSEVSDDLGDLQRSVYSVPAMRERRIEIEAMQVMPRQQAREEMDIVERVGDLHQDEERTITFTLKNEGPKPLRLIDVKADCGCTTADLPKRAIPPGGTTAVEIHFNGRAPLGNITRSVTIFTDGDPQRFRLTMEGVMVP